MDAPIRRSRSQLSALLGLGSELTEEHFELEPHADREVADTPRHPSNEGVVFQAGFDSFTRGERTWMITSIVAVLALCAVGVYLSV